MYELLTNPQVANNTIPILIVCNKIDHSIYKKTYIKRNLERELDKLRVTKASQPASQDESEKVLELVNKDGAKFTFDETARTKVSFADCCITQGTNLNEVVEFITK